MCQPSRMSVWLQQTLPFPQWLWNYFFFPPWHIVPVCPVISQKKAVIYCFHFCSGINKEEAPVTVLSLYFVTLLWTAWKAEFTFRCRTGTVSLCYSKHNIDSQFFNIYFLIRQQIRNNNPCSFVIFLLNWKQVTLILIELVVSITTQNQALHSSSSTLYYSNSIFKMFYLKCETSSSGGKQIAVWDWISQQCECVSI